MGHVLHHGIRLPGDPVIYLRVLLACATLWAMAPALAVRATADQFLPNQAWLAAGTIAGVVEWPWRRSS